MKKIWPVVAVLLVVTAASALTTIKPFRASGGVQMQPSAAWNGPNDMGGVYYKADAGLAFHTMNGEEYVLPKTSGGSGSTGNWTFTGGAASVTGVASVLSDITTGSGSTAVTLGSSNALSGASDKVVAFNNGSGTTVAYLDAPNSLLRFINSNSGISDATAGAQLAFNQAGSIFFYGTTIYPLVDNTSHLGSAANRWHDIFSYWHDTAVGAQLTAAATITPTNSIHHVTGATTITTIATTNLPTSGNVDLTLIADSNTLTFGTGGNIGAAFNIPANTSRKITFDNATTTWYPNVGDTQQTIYRNATPVSSVTTGEIDAQSYTMPANTLTADGQMVVFDAGFHHAANANSATYKFYANGTVLTTQARTSSGEADTNMWRCVRKTSSTMYCTGFLSQLGTMSTSITLLTSVNYAASIIFKTTVLGATTNGDMVADYLRGEFHP